ncbi:hypothetical protein ABFX02_01G076600 [Erythranthe guttata]
MAKIHPNLSIGSSVSSSCSSLERETFTIWMKSLVFHGNGCTVYNSGGEVVFRVDNYQERCRSEVFLMDSSGKVLFSIKRKKLGIFGCWEGIKWSNNSKGIKNKGRPCFQVRRNRRIFSRDILSCRVNLKFDENMGSYYRIIGLEGKSTLKIIDFSGQLLAEAVRKQSLGVALGEDVLKLTVEPHVDQSLIMALVTVYGSINNKL